MNIASVKLVYVVSCVALGLLILSPTLLAVVSVPGGERFSELWLLSSNRTTDGYPFNVTAGVNYSVYVGVGNHMGSSMYYVMYVKFRNETEPLPNATAGMPSPLAPLSDYRVFVVDNGSVEVPLTFSFSDVRFAGGRSYVGSVVVNGVSSRVDESVVWDSEKSGYYFQVFVELWIYNSDSGSLGYHNRFVSRWVNMTGSV